MRVARSVDAPLVHEDEAERAAERWEDLHRSGFDAAGVRSGIGDHRRDDVRIGSCETRPAHRVGELRRVDEVAVVAQGQRMDAVGLEHRLGVVPRRGPGRGVPRVADREVSEERGQGRLVEHLADQPEVLVDEDVAPVRDGDARGFLTPMLLSEQSEVGEPCDVVAGCPYAEEAALLLRRLGSHEGFSVPRRCAPEAEAPTPMAVIGTIIATR